MRITKTPKRLAPAAPEVSALLSRIAAATDDELPAILDSISEWCWPRGDLYYWTGILNRFDTILEDTCRDYELSKLQTNEFTPLRKKLIVSILRFSRLLIENCTNRKLYASYEHLNDLLLTRDLDVLEANLRLVLRPAQQHSSQSSRHEFAISKDRLATLASTWTPRDHGLSLSDVAAPDTEIPVGLFNVRFQFFKRNSQKPGLSSASAGPAAFDDDAGVNGSSNPHHAAFSTPTRPRARPPVNTSTSAAAGLTATPTPHRGGGGGDDHNRGEGSSSGQVAPQPRKEGLTVVDLGNVLQQGRDAMHILADAVEAYGIPQEEYFEVFQKIRLALALADPASRRQILVCRLLAVSCYSHLTSESTALTQLFLYEPDLIHRIAALVDPAQEYDMAIRAGAFYALDSLARFRGKATEVLNSVNASVNHGIVLSALRNLVDDLGTDEPQSSDHFVDALFSFVAFITSTGAGSHMVVGAGLVPILVQLIKVQNPNTYMVQRTVSRALGLLDSVIYSVPPAFDLFCSARGLNALVDRISQEIGRDVEDASEHKMDDSLFGEPGPDNLYGKLAFGRASMLRNMFKSISQMMARTGTGEGLRNLIDTSLPASLKTIIDHRRIFGPQILALAINIMATFVHNEPTSLSIIQECKLPESFYSAIEEDIEANYDVVGSIPHAIGALCLNQAGLDLFNSRCVIPKLFSLFTSERHSRVFQDRDNASMFGSSIDELMRHQPSIKESVMDAIMQCLDYIGRAAASFTLPEEPKMRAQYGLLRVQEEDVDVPMDSEQRIVRSVALADVITDEPDPFRKDDNHRENNALVVSIDVMARFLEGLFQTTSHCKDFLKLDGLAKLLGFYSLPCLPYDFSASMAADSLVTLIRYMTEISPSTVLFALLRDVKQALDATGPIWEAWQRVDQASSEPRLLSLARPRTDAEVEAANETFRRLVSLSSRTHLLCDICQTFAYAGHKMPTTFLQTLVASGSATTVSIAELGRLHRSCAWENMLLKATLPPPPKLTGKDENKDSASASTSPSSSTPAGSGSASRPATQSEAAAGSSGPQQAGVPADLLQDLAGTVEQPSDAVSKAATDVDSPKQQNAAALRYLASQIPSSLTSVFQETIRLLAPRRNTDAAHKKAAHQTSAEIAKVMKEHLQWRTSDNLTNSFAFATMMICQASCFLFDDRPGPGTVQTAILRAFDTIGGLEALFGLCRRYTDEIDLHYNAKGEEKPAADIEAGLKLGHTCGGLKVLLGLFLKMVTAKGLIDSSQTNQLIKEGGLDPFEPHAYLIRLRAVMLPVIRSIWDKPWLPSLPASVNRLVMQNMLTILRAASEAAPAPKKPAPAQVSLNPTTGLNVPLSGLGAFGIRRAPAQPDEERIRHLTDMGFNRNAAQYALLRCGNNLSAATEYLLMHPEVVSEMADEPEQAPQAQSENGAGSAGPTDGASTSASGTAAGPQTGETGTDEDTHGDEDQNGSTASAPQTAEASDQGAVESTSAGASGDLGEIASKPDEDDTSMKDLDSEGKTETEREELDSVKEKLDQQRSEIKASLTHRALELADVHESLVFEVKNAFSITAIESTKITSDLSSLLEAVRDSMDDAFDSREKHIALRLRLLALVLHEEDVLRKLDNEVAREIMETLVTYSMLYASRPYQTSSRNATSDGERPIPRDLEAGEASASTKWLASLMLVSVSLLGLDEDTLDTKVDNEPDSDVDSTAGSAASDVKHTLSPPKRPSAFDTEAETLFDFTLNVLERSSDLTREDLLAVYRLLSVLTRSRSIASSFVRKGGIQLLLRPFHTVKPKDVMGCQVLAMMTLRHIVEDLDTLSVAIEHEIKSLFAQSRTKSIDTSSLVRQLDYAVLRDPDVFLQVAASKLEMVDYVSTKGSGYVKLVESKSVSDANSASPSDFAANGQASLASLHLGDEPMDAASASPTKESGPPADLVQEPLKGEEAAAKQQQQQQQRSSSASAPSEDLDSLMQQLISDMLRYGRDGAGGKKPASSSTSAVATASTAAIPPVVAGAEATKPATEAAHADDDKTDAVESDEQKRDDATYFYTCFLMQTLTEMLSSYSSCKSSFVNFSRKRLFASAVAGNSSGGPPATPGGSKEAQTILRAGKANVLSFFLTEMVPAGFLQSYESVELRKRMAQSNWAMSVIVALTADVTVHADVREVPPDLVNVRRTVLDAIAKAIKDASASSESIEVRYGRLFALSELCHRLLIARPNVTSGKQTEDLTLHMAKTMLEKNFVTVLTSALADVDLNLPTVKSLLDTILRPLEHLTKVAIKMGKAKDRQAHSAVADESEEDTFESSDYSMDDDEDEDDEDDEAPGREETPDFYRNSSLGMHTGEMETGYDEDDMSDDDMDDEEDIDMEEYDSESGSERSETDEDDDEPHVVELMDEDDESGSSDDDNSDGDELGMAGEDDDEEGWTDEDEEGEDELGSMEDALDFVFDDGEGGMHVAETLEDDLDGGLMGEADLGGDAIIDEDEEDVMDDDSIEEHYENEELSQLELADDYAAHSQADDRFGANWGWTAIPDPRAGRGVGGADRMRPPPMLPPNFFLPTAMENLAGASHGRRPRLMDFEPSLMGPRRTTAQSDDVANHPLLIDQSGDGDARSGTGLRAARGGGVGGNPLDSNQPAYAGWAQSIEDLVGDGAMQFLQTLLEGGPPNSDIRIQLSADRGSTGQLRIDGVEVGRNGHLHAHQRPNGNSERTGRRGADARRNDPVAAVQAFTPQPTAIRWTEEVRILHASVTLASEKASRLRTHLFKALMPGLRLKREADRKKRAEAEAELKKAQEAKERIKKELEETQAKIRQQEERARQEQAEAEAAAAAAKAEQERLEREQQQSETVPDSAAATSSGAGDVEMTEAEPGIATATASAEQPEGAETVSGRADTTTAASDAPAERIMTRINGEEIDITDTGIDPTFLEALPDDMREEVLNQHFRERRAAEATSNLAQPSNIAPEFLEALPPEIRAEVIQQEALEISRRRMRERAEPVRAGAGDQDNEAGGGEGRRVADIDPADFLASLSSDLRNQVLLEQDESFLGSLPSNLMAEFHSLRRQHRHFDESGDELPSGSRHRRTAGAGNSAARSGEEGEDVAADGGEAKKVRAPRDAIQLLEKPGVATLVRLLFFPQMNGKQTGLYKVLANLSENSKTRAELLSLLLMVLSEGTADANAVDKSFASMSSRANKIHATPSRPTPKRFNSGPASVQHQALSQSPMPAAAPLSRTGDEAPFLIASRSIETLLHLTATNQQAALYFLRDDTRALKKGKGKDKDRGDRGSAPINVLLHLLSKDTILSNGLLVDSLLALLNTVSKPLAAIAKTQDSNDVADGEPQGGSGASADVQDSSLASGAVPSAQVQGDSAAAGAPLGGAAQAAAGTSLAAPATPAAVAASATQSGDAAAEVRDTMTLTSAPQIPSDRLAAVVKPLATAISSKGFQHTLAVASHLSTLEGARDVISDALRLEADAASKSLITDLDKLIEALPEPMHEAEQEEGRTENGSQSQQANGASAPDVGTVTLSGPTAMDLELAGGAKVHTSALTSLASPASAQAILLRCLRALDYIMTGR